jgi:hypothetical protein
MNTMRVFLHDKLWEQDAEGFKKRIDQFLAIAAKARHQAHAGVLRLVLGSGSEARAAASADSRRAQLGLGAESRPRRARGHC